MRFTCSHCGKAYARTEHLKRHIQSTHQSSRADEAPRIFACDAPGCDKTFRRSDVLARHKRGHAPVNGRGDEAAPAPSTKRIKRSSTSSPSRSQHQAPLDVQHQSDSSAILSANDINNNASTPHLETGPNTSALRNMMDFGEPGHHLSPASSKLSPSSASYPVADLAASNQIYPPAQSIMSSFRTQPSSQPLTSQALQEQQQLTGLEWSLARSHRPVDPVPSNPAPPHESVGLSGRNANTSSFVDSEISAMSAAFPDFHHSPRQPDGISRSRAAADMPFPFEVWDTQMFDQQNVAGDASSIPRLGWDSLTYKNLTGLDWIFDDGAASLTDASVFSGALPSTLDEDFAAFDDFGPKPPDSLSRATEKMFERAKGAAGEADPFESLGLINLANTAIDQANGNGTAAGRNGARAARNPDDEGEWPQDFRPMRRQPPTLEISDYTLAVEMDDDSKDDSSRGVKTSDAFSEQGSRHIPFVLIEEFSDGVAGFRPSRRNSPKLETSSSQASEQIGKISEKARQRLLLYLRHSCKHPWSVYSFNGNADKFLTCDELDVLLSLFIRKVHPYTPILHLASFDPESASPVLFLIMVTKGLVFYVSEMQARGARSSCLARLQKRVAILGPAFSELTRIGTMSAFEADQRGFLDMSINQAWLLQQLFGIGSGNKRLYKLAERNRGGIMTSIRRMGLLNMKNVRLDTLDQTLDPLDEQALERKWRAWIDRESGIRLAWFVFLYDQLYGLYMDISPMILYTEVTSPFPCDEQLWNARTAREWYSRIPAHAQSTPKASFIDVLRKLLDPPRHEDIPLRLNRLEAYVLAVTLYRIRWDTSKRSVLFGMEAFAHAEEVTMGENHVVDAASGTVAIDAAAANALQGLAEAASCATLSLTNFGSVKRAGSASNPPNLALSIDLQLLRLLSKMHFSGPPAFFDRLKDAAGRAGNARRADAVIELRRWIADVKNHVAMRQMLLASAHVYDLIRTSLDATASKPDVLVLQSHVCIVSLFHAALIMWAYDKFGPDLQSQSQKDPTRESNAQMAKLEEAALSDRSLSDDFVKMSKSQAEALPYLSPAVLRSVEESGIIDLVPAAGGSIRGSDSMDDWQERASESTNGSSSMTASSSASDAAVSSRIVEAWSLGAYRSTVDGRPRRWAAAGSLLVRVTGIGELKAGKRSSPSHNRTGQEASHASSDEGRVFVDDAMARKDPESTMAATQASREAVEPSRRPDAIQIGSMTPTLNEDATVKASRILLRFASLLRRLDWGLATNFRTILVHMARHEARSVEAPDVELTAESRVLSE